jgi:preprotein translocase subunit SecA
LVYRSRIGKYNAVVQEVVEMHATGRPVLIGTASIVTSEQLSDLLKAAQIPHTVLNAKFEAQEASIVAQAGRSGTVTIATNMAGRGTDIKLGGDSEFLLGEAIEQNFGISRFAPEAENFIKAISRQDPAATELGLLIPGVTPEFIQQAQQLELATIADHARVQDIGGLHIIGTERHESRRIDNQLRGRAGRQGDPGSSRFYVSFEDDLMRLFANDRVVAMMDRLGMDDSQPIEAKMVTGAIEKAQARVEDRNFSTRKQLLEFDNVMSVQRDTIYGQRREVLLGPDEAVEESTEGMIADFVDMQLATHAPADENPETWDIEGLQTAVIDAVPQLEGFDFAALKTVSPAEAQERLLTAVADAFDARKEELSPTMLNSLSRYVLLQVVDQHWKEHLHGMDVLRQGIGLRGYGQRDPFTEYKFEATNMFNEMIDNLKNDVTKFVFRMQFGQTG